MLDNIALTQSRLYNSTAVGGTATLQVIAASLKDTDGSETLSVELRGLIAGSVLSDGTRTFTATAATATSAGSTTATITGWNLDRLTLKPPATYQGTMALVVAAISSEPTSSGANLTATTTANLAITVHLATVVSPIVIDLNGDGIRTISIDATSAVFDLLNTGTAIRSGWLSPQDGFLAWDRNGNGRIDSRAELFGGTAGEGFAQLRELDANLDGWLDASDPLYAKLVIWQDANSNKQTDAGELTTLAQRGIRRIDLAYTNQTEWQNGNLLVEASTATTTQGTKLSVRDAYFAFEAMPAPIQPKAPSPVNAGTIIYLPVDAGIALPPILVNPPLLRPEDDLAWPPRSIDPRQSNLPVVNWGAISNPLSVVPNPIALGVDNMRRTVPAGGDVFDDSAIAAATQPTGDYREQNSNNQSQGMIEAGVELKAWFKNLLNKVR